MIKIVNLTIFVILFTLNKRMNCSCYNLRHSQVMDIRFPFLLLKITEN